MELSIYDLREKCLNYKPKTRQLQIDETKKIDTKFISNRFSLHMERTNNLDVLCRFRKYDMIGYRV